MLLNRRSILIVSVLILTLYTAGAVMAADLQVVDPSTGSSVDPSIMTSTYVSAGPMNIATMMANLSNKVPQLMQLVTALAYVMGMSFVIKGILELKKYGEQKTQMSSNAEIKGPLIFLFVGAALIYLPTTVHVGMSTFWNNPSPYQYIDEANNPWQDMLNNVFMIIQLVGTIAFIKGLTVLTQVGGSHGSQPGTLGKAMAHIIGGIFCINIYQFVQVVTNTLALGQ